MGKRWHQRRDMMLAAAARHDQQQQEYQHGHGMTSSNATVTQWATARRSKTRSS